MVTSVSRMMLKSSVMKLRDAALLLEFMEFAEFAVLIIVVVIVVCF